MKILMITDANTSVFETKKWMESKGFVFQHKFWEEAGEEFALLGIYDLLVLDMAVCGLSKMNLLRKIRAARPAVPVFLTVGQGSTQMRIECLNAGADYVLTRSGDPRELMACIHAFFRRQEKTQEQIRFGDVFLDLTSNFLICGENRVRLSAREQEVMLVLLHAQGKIVHKEMILSQVWGFDSNAVENHAEVYVGFLRKKLIQINSDTRIVAVRRMGYQLEKRMEE